MTDKGLRSLADDLATDRASFAPNRVAREIGRKLGAGGNARRRIQQLIENGAAEYQTAKRHCASCYRDPTIGDPKDDGSCHI
eukprot:433477-Pyramimonas_sp.AAC.1